MLIQPEPFNQAGQARDLCNECGLSPMCASPFLKPRIPKGWTGDYLFVSEQPLEEEDEAGHLIVGDAGQLFRKIIAQAGLAEQQCAMVNTVRCRPDHDTKPTMQQIRACAPFVLRAIQHLHPTYVIALGGVALKGLLDDGGTSNVADNRGKVLRVANLPDYTFSVTYHPAACLKGAYHLAKLIINDIKQVSEAKLALPEVGLPCNYRSELLGFDTEFKGQHLITAAGSDGKVSYVEEEKFYDIRTLLNEAKLLAAHSAYVDVDHLRALGVHREDWLKGEHLVDTYILSKMYDENRLPKSYKLENLLRSLYKVDEWKKDTELYSDSDPEAWPKDLRMERCRLDAWGTAVLAEKLLPLVKGPVEFTHKIAAVLHRIGLAGAYVDLPKLESLKQEYLAQKLMAQDQITAFAFQQGMTEFSPTNDNHIRALLFQKMKCPVLNRTKKGTAQVDKLTLKNLAIQHPGFKGVFDRLGEFSKYDKLYTTYAVGLAEKIRPLDDGRTWLPVRINPMAARTCRRASDSPNFQNWPKAVRGVICSRFKNGLIGDHDYCVDPQVKVLCADLIWKVAGALTVGEEIIAFDEEGPNRKARRGVITSLKSLTRPTVRVVTNRGSTTCSREHRWLVRSTSNSALHWKEAGRLQPGDTIGYYAEPWEVDRSQEAGYLAGFFDGEGWVSHGSVGFGQNNGPIADYVSDLLVRKGIPIKQYNSSSTAKTFGITGGITNTLRFLGSIRPRRLLPKAASKLWEGRRIWGKWSSPAQVQHVYAVRPDGPVIAIGTTTNTFIADGFLSHNSKLEIGIMAWESKDPALMKAYLSGNIYVETAAKLFNKTVEKDTDLYRVAKSIVLGVDYNMTGYKLAHELRDKLGVMLKPKWADHIEESDRLIEKYLNLYPGIRHYMRRKEAELLKYGAITTATGRVRHLPCPKGRETEGYGHLKNQAINAPIQGLASDITGSALIDVEAAILQDYGMSVWEYHYALYEKKWPEMPIIMNEVHDSLVVDFPNTDKKRMKRDQELVVEAMRAVPSLRKLVPTFDLTLNIEAGLGKHWGEK